MCDWQEDERSSTFEHVFDENAAFDNFLVGVELFVVGCDEEDHFVMRLRER